MAKTMKRNQNYKKSARKSGKRTARKGVNGSRKNSKKVSLKNQHNGHKKYSHHHHTRGLHNTRRVRYGGRVMGHRGKRSYKKMKGGMVSSPAAGPVGYSWQGSNEATWPGVASSHGINTNGQTMSNHFSLSKNGIAVGGIELARSTSDDQIITPPTNGSMNGGKRSKRHKKMAHRQKGGFFQEIVNLGRGAQDGLNSGYFNLIGKQQPLSENPYPTNQPLNDGNNSMTLSSPPDMRQLFVNANNQVAKV